MTTETVRPQLVWTLLPAYVGNVLRPGLPHAGSEILREIRLHVPEYQVAGPLSAQKLARGVDAGLALFVRRLELRNATDGALARWFRRIGRQEFADGRSLGSLLTVYRLGGQVAWRLAAANCQRADLSTAVLCLVGEAIFAYVNEISRLSTDGYTTARRQSAGVIERRRRQLRDALLADQPARHQLADLADAANWPVPARLSAVAFERPQGNGDQSLPGFGSTALADLDGPQPYLLTPDPDRDLADLSTELPGWRAAVGPPVPVENARSSLRVARRALTAVRTGALPDKLVTTCADHLADLWLLSDPVTARALGDRVLAPLASLTPKQRSRLGDTLLAWLEARGGAPEMAVRLGVHPQTVRYRVHQLETLFGDSLRNPDLRFDMELALRAQRLGKEA
ncbi:PucR family transcriptional regulator [Fodinicola acaciae]|uniref:PucR family transcriptional regulator n=1 Tax=Fodinicola acaciae TaxID=2681555 RepID=UPI0013D8ACAB|nr:helix-turn-helix domain-containing protein [Fodinicola acaciae]